jgi:glycerophosphoryl diester phosphodiesterase
MIRQLVGMPRTNFFFPVIVFLVLFLASCSGFNFTRTLDEHRSTRLCWIAAHKGEQASGVENGEKAIRAALSSNAEIIEVDLRSTADGDLYLFPPGSVEEIDEQGTLDGNPFSSLSSSELKRGKVEELGIPAPLGLEDALTLISDRPGTLLLDMTNASLRMVERARKVAAASGQLRQLLFQFYEPSLLKSAKSRYPELQTLCRAKAKDDIRECLNASPEVLQVDPDLLGLPEIRVAQGRKLRVLVRALGPLDHSDGWASLYKGGADIVLTDYPGRLREYITQKGVKALCSLQH